MDKQNSFSRRLVGLVAGRKFFWAVVALLVLQAAWIALSGRYPMAFDEDFHLGIIRFYAHHISPFWTGHPAGADAYGAVARDPSYLYHYLMSFPYRLVSLVTHNQAAQVLTLRFINIGLFAAGLPLYRRLLLKTRASEAAVNFGLLLFVLIPVVPFLAAQINYDNLILPLTAVTLLLAVRFNENLNAKRPLDVKTLLWLMIVCLLASLVKYAFLPIALAVGLYTLARLLQTYGRRGAFWQSLRAGWHRPSLAVRGLLVALLCLSAVLFGERYVVNIARYHTPVPDCAKVLTVKQCSAYGPWIRDYLFTTGQTGVPFHKTPVIFMHEWLYGMWLRLFFAVDGPPIFVTRGPLPVPAIGGLVFTILAIIAVAAVAPRLLRRYNRRILWLFGLSASIYVVILWLDEYRAFLHTGQPVAINGRYLLPIMPPLLLIGIMGINELLGRRRPVKLSLATLAVFCLLWGGGALTFVLRSDNAWYWQNPAVRTVNQAVKRSLGPVMPGYTRPTEFLR